MTKRTITALAATAAMVLAAGVGVTADASAAPASATVPNSAPAWTASAHHLGHAAAGGRVSARVYLAPRGGSSALARAAQAVSDPHSAQYGKFLTPAQYQARFGTTAATVASVRSYLRSAGLHVSAASAHNRYVTVTGTVRAAEKAFGTKIERFVHHGKTVQAPKSAVKLPASIGASVISVAGLDTTPALVRHAGYHPAKEPAGFRPGTPCSTYYGEKLATDKPQFRGRTLPYNPCGYVGSQFRGAFEGDTSLDGSGVTVAITDAFAAPSIKQDANTYAVRHGDGAFKPGQFTQTGAAPYQQQGQHCAGKVGWYGEETLDVEAVHAMAPGANIHYFAARNCNDDGFLDTLGLIVDTHAAQLVSNSWADYETATSAPVIAAYEQIFQQGAVEGISFMFSSGDDGDELAATGTKQTDYPSSDPWVTAVGGTSTAIGADNQLLGQSGWGTKAYALNKAGKKWTPAGFLYGAGGGTSAVFHRPSYQDGTVSDSMRTVPDVAMDADPNTGMLVGERQSFSDGNYYDEYRIGGTSLASPLFAGITALAVQHAGGRGPGLLNPTIYANQAAFTDVTNTMPDPGNVRADFVNSENASDGVRYTVRTFGHDSSLATTPGYDQVTGVGTPNPGWFSALD